jgi:two-component system phosphate regulon response regulator OmpR
MIRHAPDVIRPTPEGSIRVLIVEDEPDVADIIRRAVRSASWSPAVVGNGREALLALAGEEYDLLVLDVGLPDLDGFEVCRRIRARADTPILMLTARGDDTDRIVGLELGADDYLPKPFNPRELLARLRAILRRRSAGPDHRPVLRFGRLEIDREARQVRLDGRERPLTSHQFDLLAALADSAGRVLSREALMERVRGDALEAFDRSIDVHVSRIRAAIEDDPRHPRRILTVRGAGYVFARAQDDD